MRQRWVRSMIVAVGLLLSLAVALPSALVYGQEPAAIAAAQGWIPLWETDAPTAETAVVGNRALFAAGTSVTVFDSASRATATHALTQARSLAAVVEHQVVFTGRGSGGREVLPDAEVETYDAETDAWSVVTTTGPVPGFRGTAVGNRVLFLGDGDENAASDRVTILDISMGTVVNKQLSASRMNPFVSVIGQQAFILGSQTQLGRTLEEAPADSRAPVDIYDAATDSWSVAYLSDGRFRDMTVTTLDTSLIVAGGGLGRDRPSSVVDIYNTATRNWSTTRLSQPRMGARVARAGRHLLFGGGYTGFVGPAQDPVWTKTVDVFNADTGVWMSDTLSAGWLPLPFGVGEYGGFAGGFQGARMSINGRHETDVYASATGNWTRSLSLNRGYMDHPIALTVGTAAALISRENLDLFDGDTASWTAIRLPSLREDNGSAVAVGSLLLVTTRKPGEPNLNVVFGLDLTKPGQ